MSFVNHRKHGGIAGIDKHLFPGHSKRHGLELSRVARREDGGSVTLNLQSPGTNMAAGFSNTENNMSGFGMTGDLPGGAEHQNKALQYPGEAIGAAVGSIWGAPGLGSMAGKNAGLTIGDLAAGNMKNVGWDVSSNLPPGFQDTGAKGLLNTATGLPLSKIFRRGGLVARDDGGSIPAVGGVQPSSQEASPMSQDMIAQYANMTPEQLQETVSRVGPASPAGQLAARMLQQKKVMPGSTASAAQVSGQNTSANTTGQIPHLAEGGGIPYGVYQQMFANAGHPSSYGLLNSPSGAAGGRTDTLPHAVAADSYVIPADVVSGLGEGDTMSGAKVLDAMLHTMPFGGARPPQARSHPPPAPPQAYRQQAKGGKNMGAVPVIVANGEFVVRPDAVRALGEGNAKRGHKVLDAFVLHVRKKTADTLRKLPPPVK